MATWSPLVSKIRESGDNSGNRWYSITRITPHCWVGQVSVENGLDYFATTSRQVSSNYIIGSDGRIGGCVREEYRAWTSSSRDNDNRAITIECASDRSSPYAFRSCVYDSLIDLCVDICQRYGKKKLLWFSSKSQRLNYDPDDDEMVLTMHRDFTDTDCPGQWMVRHMEDLADVVTAKLNGEPGPTPTPTNRFTVCTNSGVALRLRAEPNTDSSQIGWIDNGTTFTSDEIVEGESIGGCKAWVKYNGGYAAGKYLVPTPTIPAPSPTPQPDPQPEPTPEPQPAPTPTGKKYEVHVNTKLNVRYGPGTNNPIVRQLDNGDIVEVVERNGSWGRIGTHEWVCMDYLEEAGTGTRKTVSVNTSLNVRSGPGTSYRVVDSLYNGDVVYVIDTEGGWSKIGSGRWVYSKYLV